MRFKIKQTSGKNLRTRISKLLVKSPIEAVKELLSNSYDADAQNVHVVVDETKRTLLVEDDGHGIREEGLEGFVRMGDSEKVENPISPNGRERIGQYGIAQTLIEFLGDSFKLDSWTGNTHIIGREVFQGSRGLEYETRKIKRKRKGTKILIGNVNWIGKSEFSSRGIKSALTWEMPDTEDLPEGDFFNKFFNGQELVRRNGKPLQKFHFKENLDNAGPICMSVDYFVSRPPINGVYVFVNNRSVGKPEYFDITKVKRVLEGKLYARVDANGLKHHISFNRGYFQEDNPVFRSVRKWVYSCLGKVGRAVVVSSGKKPKPLPTLSTREIRETIDEVEYHPVVSVQSDNGKNKGSKKTVRPNEPLPDYKQNSETDYESNVPLRKRSDETQRRLETEGFHTAKRGAKDPQAVFNPQNRQIIINVNNPWYRSHETTNREVAKAHVLLGSAFAFAQGIYLEEEEGVPEYVERFNSLCGRLLDSDDFVGDIKLRTGQQQQGGFIPFRKYDVRDVLDTAQLSLATLRNAIDAGVVRFEDEKISGEETNIFLRRIENHTPAMEVVRQYKAQTGVTRQRVEQVGEMIDEVLQLYERFLPFVVNIGVDQPFYLIENQAIPQFLGLYAQGVVVKPQNLDIHMRKHRELFKKVLGTTKTDRYVGLNDLCEATRGSPHDVFKIVGFAQRRGINLRPVRKDNQVLYSLPQFKKARQEYLMGGQNV